jgi:enamine deaminase RidA (YjgF/YER057c/UK114 family)
MAFDRIDPPELGEPRGFTHGMLAPAGARILLVAGQDAAEPGGHVTTDDFVEQFRIALSKALTVVRAAGGGPESIGRMTIYVTDVAAYRAQRRAIGAVYRDLMGRHFPAMALVEVRALVDPRARVEIEATAALPDAGPNAATALAEGLP